MIERLFADFFSNQNCDIPVFYIDLGMKRIFFPFCANFVLDFRDESKVLIKSIPYTLMFDIKNP